MIEMAAAAAVEAGGTAYTAGELAASRLRSSQFLLLRVGPFPDVWEDIARAQLAKWTDGDEDWRRAPLDASYVSGLFDQFATTFEQKLVGDLSYRGHLQCAGLLARSLPKRPGVVAVDLGVLDAVVLGAPRRVGLPL